MECMSFFSKEMCASLIGAAVGGFFVLVGTFVSFRLKMGAERKRQQCVAKDSLIALNKETNLLFELHGDIFSLIENQKWVFSKITQNYFSTYEENLKVLILVPDEEYQ